MTKLSISFVVSWMDRGDEPIMIPILQWVGRFCHGCREAMQSWVNESPYIRCNRPAMAPRQTVKRPVWSHVEIASFPHKGNGSPDSIRESGSTPGRGVTVPVLVMSARPFSRRKR